MLLRKKLLANEIYPTYQPFIFDFFWLITTIINCERALTPQGEIHWLVAYHLSVFIAMAFPSRF